ncbi:HTH-type transcriptional repressor RspR [Pseudomonas extremaustralis]|uniref:HTH-type transcriptional repressor RspR n=1 Tax=Pseudomonas extremaustralis TaxID=359110 RepID=A0A5M9IQJ0_9PSED|nr:GntR family transcriptional regulator [Pseudomonas extremaustralis]KAA8558323.1 HTH-type transcriptional repressor RspR [Pseudomonas extremaustralis]
MTGSISKPRKSDSAYERLRSAIIRAELEPGSLIEERDMMERLDIGRTPLREALQRLAHEDLVMAVPQRGYFVSATSAADFFQLSEFRDHSEVLAIRSAAVRITNQQLERLKSLIDEAREGVAARIMDQDWHLAIDERLHKLVAEASGNRYLAQALNRLYALSVRSLYVARVPVTLLFEELENFSAIYEALAAHDADRAEQAMRNHLDIPTVQAVQIPARKGTHKAAANAGKKSVDMP